MLKNKHNDINKTIDMLLKTNIEFKYKKSTMKSNDQLIKDLIELELNNNLLEKSNSNYKYQLEVLKQKNIDLQIELNELKHQFKKTEVQELKGKYKTAEVMKDRKFDKSDDYEITEDNYSLLESIKKTRPNDTGRLFNDITNLLKELQMTKDKVQEKEDIIIEKDNIINILYQEIENMKVTRLKEDDANDTNSLMNSPEFQRRRNDHFSFNKIVLHNIEEEEQFKKSHLENLDLIKLTLLEFLEKYNIRDNISFEENAKDIDAVIEARMKEIKYIMVNMKKINILFKTLFKEFSKSVHQTVDGILNNQINQKIELMNKRLTRLAIDVERKVV
jgi:hypothetical protein